MHASAPADPLARAEAALALARPAEAERLAREALAANPGGEAAAAVLVRALALGGRRPEALRAAAEGLARCPDSEWLHRLRAAVLADAGRHGDALAAASATVGLVGGFWAYGAWARRAGLRRLAATDPQLLEIQRLVAADLRRDRRRR
jgi:tetratricopeptide (TPR) repeat protein